MKNPGKVGFKGSHKGKGTAKTKYHDNKNDGKSGRSTGKNPGKAGFVQGKGLGGSAPTPKASSGDAVKAKMGKAKAPPSVGPKFTSTDSLVAYRKKKYGV